VKKNLSSFFLFYLRLFARLQLAKITLFSLLTKGKKPTIIGLTGSAGKSTLMEAISSILSIHFKVKTSSSGNSETGLPLSLLDLKITNYSSLSWLKIALLVPFKLLVNWQTYNYFLAEMGIDEPDEPKNMSYLLKIIQPRIGIILNISSVHSMQFDKTVSKNIKGRARLSKILQNITKEKAKLITHLPPNGLAIINSDDPFLKPLATKTRARVLTLGKSEDNNLVIKKVKTSPHLFLATYQYQNQTQTLKIGNYALPENLAHTFGLAILTGLSQNIDLKTCLIGLKNNLFLPPSRSSLLKGIKNTTIIDSSYNSSPLATHSILRLLSRAPRGKRVAILGDMRELGLQSVTEHRLLARITAQSADLIILVGPLMKKYFLPQLKKLSFPESKVFHFPHYQAAILKVKKIIQPGQTILVKGSQNTIFLEEVVKSLISPSNLKIYLQKNLICRQSPFWLKTKKDFLNSIAK
jgi:UDP-N-acetylmuramoyl-tripeptide--D-alanyl-D-alanine ligase